mgnify:CR=1 FL=1
MQLGWRGTVAGTFATPLRFLLGRVAQHQEAGRTARALEAGDPSGELDGGLCLAAWADEAHLYERHGGQPLRYGIGIKRWLPLRSH